MRREPSQEASTTWDLVWWPAELFGIALLAMLVLFILGSAVILGHVLREQGMAEGMQNTPLGIALLAVIAIAVVGAPRYLPMSARIGYRIELWSHGFAVGWGKSLRFVPFASVASITQSGPDIDVLLRDGTHRHLAALGPAHGERYDLLLVERIESAKEIKAALDQEIAGARPLAVPARPAALAPEPRPADFAATVALLARRARPVDVWHADLRKLEGGPHYRVATVRPETLARIADDPEVDADTREGARLVLGARLRD